MGILQIFDSFYEEVSADTKPQPGHIFWVPTPSVHETPRILDVDRATSDEYELAGFEIKEIASHHFKKRERPPIKRLSLGETEEVIISKAKRRPAVIITSIISDDIDTLSDGSQKRLAQHLKKPCYLVAPMYSVSTMIKPGTFGPVLVARIRALQYPRFFCLPDPKKPNRPESIIRLDRIFPTYLGRGCEAQGKKIHKEPFEILLSQFSILSGSVYREPYDLVKELIQDALPEELDNIAG